MAKKQNKKKQKEDIYYTPRTAHEWLMDDHDLGNGI